MSHQQARPSILQTFSLAIWSIPVVIRAIASIGFTVLQNGDYSSKAIARTVRTCLGRCMWDLPVLQVRGSLPTTGHAVRAFCQEEGLKHEAINLDVSGSPSANLHFINISSSHDGDVLLYFHGGGYVLPIAGTASLKVIQRAASLSSRSLVVLEYTLAPESKYPGQLAQASAALQFLLRNHKMSQLVVGGDSAGGNLTLALLAHMQKPHPSIQPISLDPENDQLAAVFGLSPRTGIDTTASSYDYNAHKDYMGRKSMALISRHWQPNREHIWAVPIRGDETFWSGVKAKKVLLIAGADEVYVDDVREMARLLHAVEKPGAPRELKICEGEVHDQWLLDAGAGIEDGIMTRSLLDWSRTI